MKRPEGCGNHSCRVNPPKKRQQGTNAGCMCGKVRRSEYIQFLEWKVDELLEIIYTAQVHSGNSEFLLGFLEGEVNRVKDL